ncbi:MAG: peptidyl-prolyl cis-trans isomerase [Cyanobacteria bacterium REEB67]|nr:peptidyl-prolyl cis-trans isomerase [Cyanobacteria bacterium REEB67]
MNKSTLSSVASLKALTLIVAASLSLSACVAPKADKGGDGKGDSAKKTDATASGTDTAAGTASGSTTSSTSTETSTATTTDSKPAAPPAGQSGAAPEVKSELDDLPQLNAVRDVNLSKLKDTTVICTVNGTPITVTAFKKEFREAVVSLQNMLTTQPGKVNQLLGDAKAMGVQLTDDERKRLLETAKHKEALEGKSFADFLKDKKITEAQFNEQVLMLGLAFKTGTRIIEGQLLSEIINRELVLQAARAAHYDSTAMNHFITFKHSPRYDEILKNSNATAEQIKDEVVNHEMIALMMEQIAKTANLPESALKAQYDSNKDKFKHGERLRLSHIVIAAPAFDNPPLESIRTQIKKQKPNLTPDELNKEEQVLKVHQQNLATEILARALKGEDFKSLADRYTDDVQARSLKAGGDLGFIDLSVPIKGPNGAKSDQQKLTDAVKGLKVGAVAPNLVQTGFGYHIVKLTERQPAGLLTFAEVKPTLAQILGAQNKELAEMNWIREQRKKANIVVSDELTRAAAQQKSAQPVR